MNNHSVHDQGSAAILLKKHTLPPLTYDYVALQPVIDARTMTLYHDVHHAAYVDQLNAGLEPYPALRNASALWLLRHLDEVPETMREAVRHNAGGHVNHRLFWRAKKPAVPGQTANLPTGLLGAAIDRDFGDFATFKSCFEDAGASLAGAGWVWLLRMRQGGTLDLMTTAGHDQSLMQGRFPVLLNDVWEHAYYLQYESRRAAYLKTWWAVADWNEAARRFDLADDPAEGRWEAEGGPLLALPASTHPGQFQRIEHATR